MELIMLGTQSGSPTRQRQTSSVALRHDSGAVWICDVGEATQHQILHTAIRPGRIECIMITHCHGDHLFGLPGLLASLAVHDRRQPVQLIVPQGTRAWIDTTLSLSDMHLPFALHWHEVDPTCSQTGEIRPDAQPHEISGSDHQTNPEIKSETKTKSEHWTWQTVPLQHRLPSMAFILRQPAQPGVVDPEHVARLGLQGPQVGQLLRQRTLALADGRTVDAAMIQGPARPGKVLVLCGDSYDTAATSDLVNQVKQPDLLLHECTYDRTREAQAQQWGHTHSEQLGQLAAQLQPKQLVATHFSSRYTNEAASFTLQALAEEIITSWQTNTASHQPTPSISQLVMADDRQVVSL